MGAASRRKGLSGENEVRRVLEAAGWTVRGLEGQGDQLTDAEYAYVVGKLGEGAMERLFGVGP